MWPNSSSFLFLIPSWAKFTLTLWVIYSCINYSLFIRLLLRVFLWCWSAFQASDRKERPAGVLISWLWLVHPSACPPPSVMFLSNGSHASMVALIWVSSSQMEESVGLRGRRGPRLCESLLTVPMWVQRKGEFVQKMFPLFCSNRHSFVVSSFWYIRAECTLSFLCFWTKITGFTIWVRFLISNELT